MRVKFGMFLKSCSVVRVHIHADLINAYQESILTASVLDLDGLAAAMLDALFGYNAAGNFRWTHHFAGAGSRPCLMLDSRSCYSDDGVVANHC